MSLGGETAPARVNGSAGVAWRDSPLGQGFLGESEALQVNQGNGAVGADEEILGFAVGFPVKAAVLRAGESTLGLGDGFLRFVAIFGGGGEVVNGHAGDRGHDHDAGGGGSPKRRCSSQAMTSGTVKLCRAAKARARCSLTVLQRGFLLRRG